MDFDNAIFYVLDSSGNEMFGTMAEIHDAGFSPDLYTHSNHYGRGAFEGIRMVPDASTDELHALTFREHLERLRNSCSYLRLMEVDVDGVSRNTGKLVQMNIAAGNLDPGEGCYIRHLVYTDKLFVDGERQTGMGVFSQGHRKTMTVGLFPWGAYLKADPQVRVYEDGIDSPLRRIKATSNYGFGGLAKDIAILEGFDEALITDPSSDRNILEGGGENVFFVFGNKVATPDRGQAILPGTKRGVLINILQAFGVQLEERLIPLSEGMEADAAIFTGTAAGVTGIGRIYNPMTERSTDFDNECEIVPGVSVRTLERTYDDLIHGRPVPANLADLQRSVRTPLELLVA